MNSVTRAAALCSALSLAASAAFAAQPADQVDKSILAHAKVSMEAHLPKAFAGSVANIDAITNFQGSFHERGQDSLGNPNSNWTWNMVGNAPTAGGTTTIDAPVVAVSLRLLDANGHQRYLNGHRLFMDGGAHLRDLLHSPVFRNALYSSSTVPTQFADAVQRAEFWSSETQDWHTLLKPRVIEEQVISVPMGKYAFALNADGSCCAFVLVDYATFSALLFPPTYPVDDTTVLGREERAGEATTKNIITLAFQDTYLYFNGDTSQCCVLGFHGPDIEPGTAENGNLERFYAMIYTSWISPGLFGASFVDVTAASHEMSETFNDPLAVAVAPNGSLVCNTAGAPICENTTPWWLSPNGGCQNDLEVGDVVEGLPNATTVITIDGVAYHPQNVALLQYFEFSRDSDAIGGAYTYPDASVITSPSVPQKAGCTGPLHVDD
jgi:hypothetical protein